jgi:hypothetical protein
MSKIAPTTKEQVIHYLVHNISLGTYDKKFLNNIYETNKPLTTNQNELLDKIILRYSRQLAKNKLVAFDLTSLPWTRPLIISSPEFTEAMVYTEEDKLCIRTPYKKNYIQILKDSKYPIIWDRDTRIWITDYCTETLKYVIEHTENNFAIVNYSKDIKNVIEELYEFEKYKYWNPTLVYLNDRYYLVAANEYVYDAVGSLLENVNLYVITKLARHGITIDNSILHNMNIDEDMLTFAKETQPTLEADNTLKLVAYLKSIECEVVLVYNSTYFDNFLTKELNGFLEENNIKVVVLERQASERNHNQVSTIVKQYKCSVLLTNNMRTALISNMYTDKVIHLVNSSAPQKVKSMYETM